MIDGGRLDRAQNSKIFNALKSKSVFFSQTITYSPHTIAAMHAVFSGTYGTRSGTNSYWSTFKFKKDKFKTLTEYLKDNNFYTHADVINELVVPKQGFDNFIVHDELNDDLTKRHKELLKKTSIITQENKNFFLYLHYSKIHTGIMNEVLKVYNNNSKEFFDNKTKNEQRYNTLFKNAEIYLQSILDEHTEPWGIKVSTVEVKAIDLPIEMQRAMAKQAEAERDKRAKVISAQGEFDAALKLSEAAKVLNESPNAITLRYLDTMKEISSGEGKSTTFFPLPVDFLTNIMGNNK